MQVRRIKERRAARRRVQARSVLCVLAVAALTLSAAPAPGQGYIVSDRIDLAAGEVVLRAPGYLHVAGIVQSYNFPGIDSAAVTNAGYGMRYVAKIDLATRQTSWVRVVGAPSKAAAGVHFAADEARGLAVHSDGAAYLVAYEASADYPQTGGTYATATLKYVYRVTGAGVITRHSGALDPAIRRVGAIALDAAGNIFLTGSADSGLQTSVAAAFPTSAVATGCIAPFVLKLDPTGQTTLYATYLGYAGTQGEPCGAGSGVFDPTGFDLAIDAAGNAVVGGQAEPGVRATTGAPDFGSKTATIYVPTATAYASHAFVTKLNASGSGIIFTARLGGSFKDRVTSVVLDSTGAAYIGGKTSSSDFPTAGQFGSLFPISFRSCPGFPDAPEMGFVAKLAPDGKQLVFSGFLPMSGDQLANCGGSPLAHFAPVKVALDGQGRLHATGATDSTRDYVAPLNAIPTVSPLALLYVVAANGQSIAYYSGYAGIRPQAATIDQWGNFWVAADTLLRLSEGTTPVEVTNAQPLCASGGVLTARVAGANDSGTVEFLVDGTSVGSASVANSVAQSRGGLGAGRASRGGELQRGELFQWLCVGDTFRRGQSGGGVPMNRPLRPRCLPALNRTACRWAGWGRALLLLLALALALNVVGSAHGGALWWHGDAAVTRFDPATGQLRTLPLPAPVRALASTSDEGAWVAYGGMLVRLGTDLAPRLTIVLPAVEPATLLLAAADDEGGVWIAHGDTVQHYDGTGERIAVWQHGAPILALAAGGRSAIFVGDQQAIHRYNDQGDVIRIQRLKEDDLPSGMLLDRRGGYLWLLGRDAAAQLDVLTGLTERTRVPMPAGLRAVALDPASGALWLLGPKHFVALDRDGTQVDSSPVPLDATDMPTALAVERAADRLWIGDRRGTTAFNRQSLQWIRLTDGEATIAIAGSFAALVPQIETAGLDDVTPKTMRFVLGAACDPVPCAVSARYLQTLRPNFELDGRAITDHMAVDAAAGTVDVHEAQPLPGEPGILRAEVVDAYGNRSPPLEIDVRAHLAASADAQRARNNALKALPTVSITTPLNNAKFVAPATVAIAASAAASGATLTKVEFYRDAVLLGTDTSAPYSYNWTNVSVGTYKLTAKAYDNAGGVTTSAIVNIQVNANVAPTVKLTTPANNSAYTAPATINLAATATDTDGTITKVEFYRGTTKLYTATVAPYTYTWSNAAGGTYSLTARATDDKGAVTTSTAVTVKVNKPPTVALTAPANNTVLVSPTKVTISASASDADGTVSKVQFYRDGVLLGTDTTSPYSYAWTNVPPGTYTLTARATDNLGATTDSAPRTLTVGANQAPVVVLTAPAHGTSVVAGKPVTLTATASDADGTISNVKFYAQIPTVGSVLLGTDTTSPYGITVPLYAGDNVLTAVATDNKGAATTSAPVTVTVRSNQDPVITLVSPADGQMFPSLSPPDIALAATAADADGSIVRVRFYYVPWPTEDNPDPARVTIATVTSPPFQAVWPAVPHTGTGFCDENGCAPDGYEVIAEATDDAGGVAEASASITVPAFSSSSIRLTAPKEIQPLVYTAPATLVLTAAATVAASVPVVKVQFLADGNVIGTVNGAGNGANGEYVYVWRNIGAGIRSLQARLYDSAGFVVDSAALAVTVRDVTSPPIVTVTTPTNEQTFMTGYQGYPSIPAAVVATDADGTVAQVGILFDDALASSGTTSPHSATWNQVRPGLHVIAGNAMDNGFAKSLARPVYVRVLENPRLQAVVLTAPAPGSMTNPVVLEAQVGAPDGGVDKVQFYDGATLIGTVTAQPYRLTASLSNGAHALKAVAYLYSNANLASTPVNVTVSGSNVPPNVTLTMPTAGQSFPVGANVPLAATATDTDGTVSKVDFFVGTTLVATATDTPIRCHLDTRCTWNLRDHGQGNGQSGGHPDHERGQRDRGRQRAAASRPDGPSQWPNFRGRRTVRHQRKRERCRWIDHQGRVLRRCNVDRDGVLTAVCDQLGCPGCRKLRHHGASD